MPGDAVTGEKTPVYICKQWALHLLHAYLGKASKRRNGGVPPGLCTVFLRKISWQLNERPTLRKMAAYAIRTMTGGTGERHSQTGAVAVR